MLESEIDEQTPEEQEQVGKRDLYGSLTEMLRRSVLKDAKDEHLHRREALYEHLRGMTSFLLDGVLEVREPSALPPHIPCAWLCVAVRRVRRGRLSYCTLCFLAAFAFPALP